MSGDETDRVWTHKRKQSQQLQSANVINQQQKQMNQKRTGTNTNKLKITGRIRNLCANKKNPARFRRKTPLETQRRTTELATD